MNNLIRATGLRRTTPKHILNQVLGTDLTDFVKQSIIINGMKSMHTFGIVFHSTKAKGWHVKGTVFKGTYMECFKKTFNKMEAQDREKIVSMNYDFKRIKYFLKTKRKKKYVKTIHTDFKWVDFSKNT